MYENIFMSIILYIKLRNSLGYGGDMAVKKSFNVNVMLHMSSFFLYNTEETFFPFEKKKIYNKKYIYFSKKQLYFLVPCHRQMFCIYFLVQFCLICNVTAQTSAREFFDI